jgi:cobalamin-dependent methionine synthase I
MDAKVAKASIECGGRSFDTGPIIARGLAGSTQIAFFAATCGEGFDEWYKFASREGDTLLAYTIDSAGSVIAEKIADAIEKIAGEVCGTRNLGISNRYSPGYCGWDVSDQKKLFSLLPTQSCGITLTESALMLPIKSVSGIIGIGEHARKKNYECAVCDRKDCIMHVAKNNFAGRTT